MNIRTEPGSEHERGPRWGWIGGFLGGTCWIPILSGVLLLHRDVAGGGAGMLLCAAALVLAFLLRPWKHPDVGLWKLYLGAVFPVFLSAGFLVWRYGMFVNPDEKAVEGLYAVFPLALPVFILGKKTWKDLNRRA
jgi:hypothetical protein